MAADRLAIPAAPRSTRRTCPPPPTTTGHNATMPTRRRHHWTCPTERRHRGHALPGPTLGTTPPCPPAGPPLDMSPGRGTFEAAVPWLRSMSSPPWSCATPCAPASCPRGRPRGISWTASPPKTGTLAPSSLSPRSRPCWTRPQRTSRTPGPRGTGPELALLHGMPVAFKDLTDVAGVVTTHGSAALDHKPALADGALVAALKSAGVCLAGQDPGSGVRADGVQREPDRAALAEPARPQPQLGRFHRRQRRGGGRRTGSLCPRFRRRRFGPHPGRRVRARGPETRPRAGSGG